MCSTSLQLTGFRNLNVVKEGFGLDGSFRFRGLPPLLGFQPLFIPSWVSERLELGRCCAPLRMSGLYGWNGPPGPGWLKRSEKALPTRWSVHASSQRCGAGSDGDHSLRKSHHGSRISDLSRVCIRVESGGPFAFSPQLTGFIGQNCESL